MTWADKHIQKLKKGETVKFRPRGTSMIGKIESGQLVTVEPLKIEEVQTRVKNGSVVLCKVKGKSFLHLVFSVSSGFDKFLIGSTRGYTNGWTAAKNIFGIVTDVQP